MFLKKRLFRLFRTGFLVLFGVAPLCAISYDTYTMPDGFNYNYDGLGRDWNGNIYVGIGNGHLDSTGNAGVYKFNFNNSQFVKILDVRSVSQAAGNWQTLDKPGKIHSSLSQGVDGKIYFSTHSAIDGMNDFEDYPVMFRGGHFYRFDPVSGIAEDMSAPNTVGNEGIFEVGKCLNPDLTTRYLVGIAYPFGRIWKLNLTTNVHTVLGYTNADGGSISRKIFDDNYGRVYCPAMSNIQPSAGKLMIFDPARDSFDTKGISLRDSTINTGGFNCVTAVVKSMSGDSIYFIAIPYGGLMDTQSTLLRFIVPLKKLENLGRVDTTYNDYGYRANLHLRWDLNRLYFANLGKLYSLDVITGERAVVATNLPNGPLYGSDGVDKNGDLWFTRAHSGQVYRVRLNIPCPVCTTKFSRFTPPTEVERGKIPRTGTNTLSVNVFPNPVENSAVLAAYAGPEDWGGPIRLEIRDIHGRLVNGWTRPGGSVATLTWDGSDARGQALPAGVYFVSLKAGGKQAGRSFVKIR